VLSDSGLHRRVELSSTDLVVTRECLRAKIDTRLTGVAFGSDSYVCVDSGSLFKASMRAVGKKRVQCSAVESLFSLGFEGNNVQGFLNRLLIC
jgi:hypothetical protein